jgi:hypothetical protein
VIGKNPPHYELQKLILEHLKDNLRSESLLLMEWLNNKGKSRIDADRYYNERNWGAGSHYIVNVSATDNRHPCKNLEVTVEVEYEERLIGVLLFLIIEGKVTAMSCLKEPRYKKAA